MHILRSNGEECDILYPDIHIYIIYQTLILSGQKKRILKKQKEKGTAKKETKEKAKEKKKKKEQ